MGLLALVYAFPNIDGVGGFWLVFATGTAVAAWINFGSPRISYGGYQTGLAFYKATLQNLGPAVSATVVRDRLIGVAFGLIVFGLVEHLLWPVRAADRMHARLADVFRSLAAFARVASRPPDERGTWMRVANLISQQVADVQGFIESSKFEPGAAAADAQAVERLTADAQTVFLVLLAIARDAESAAMRPDAVRAATMRVDEDVAAILDGLADRVQPGGGGARDRCRWLAGHVRTVDRRSGRRDRRGRDIRGSACAVPRARRRRESGRLEPRRRSRRIDLCHPLTRACQASS